MTKPSPEHREEAQGIVRLWCADTFDSMKNGESMQSPPGSMTSLTNRIAAALSARDQEVREVLERLSRVLHYTHGQPERCCCPDLNSNWTHAPACLAARGLWERVAS